MLEKHVASELASDKTLNRMEKKASGMEVLKVRSIPTTLYYAALHCTALNRTVRM